MAGGTPRANRSAAALKAAPTSRAFGCLTALAGRWRNDLLITCTALTTGGITKRRLTGTGLARQFGYASWHQSALYFKRNVLSGCFIPQAAFPPGVQCLCAGLVCVRQRVTLRCGKNRLNGLLGLRHLLAKIYPPGSDLDTYWFIRAGLQDHLFIPVGMLPSSTRT